MGLRYARVDRAPAEPLGMSQQLDTLLAPQELRRVLLAIERRGFSIRAVERVRVRIGRTHENLLKVAFSARRTRIVCRLSDRRTNGAFRRA